MSSKRITTRRADHSAQPAAMFSSITNCYEQLVLDQIYRVWRESFPQPPEQDLLLDITCLALNQLPARYVRHSVDLLAHMSTEESRQMQRQVVDAVARAIEIAKRPRNTGS